MPQISLTDSLAIRYIILYEAKSKTPIFEGYKKLCGVIGHENIDFPEYEFWYYRFYSRNFDLEDDRNSISQPLTFMDLPMDSLAEIISHLDVKNRMNVRKVSKSLRDVIDSQKTDHSQIYIKIAEKSVPLQLNDFFFVYSENSIDDSPPDWEPGTEILDKNFQKIALKDLENVLKSAHNVQNFDINFNESSSKNQFESFLKVMENMKFDLKEFEIQVKENEEALKILSVFEPGKLEFIYLGSLDKNGNFNDLLEMDQFIMAKSVDTEAYGILDSSLIDQFFRFDDFVLRLEEIRKEDVIRIQTALEKQPGDRDWTFFSDNLDRVEVEQAIDQSRVIEYYDNGFFIFYETKIPNSEYFISIQIVEGDFLTMKKYK